MNSPTLQSRSQRGGTLMGFIVGLLIGLAGALSVAIYVTRVPVPFVDRGVSRNPAEDAVEAERNKGWNPNAGLGGKESAVSPSVPAPAPQAPDTAEESAPSDDNVLPPENPRPASPTVPAPATAPAPAGAKAPATEPGNSAAKPPAPGTAAAKVSPPPAAKTPPAVVPAPNTPDPLGELAQSRMGQTPAATPAAAPAATPDADVFTYFVQAGAFRSPEDAEAHRAKLAMQGFAANVTEREQSGKTVYRVRLGPYGQKTQADSTRDQLATKGVEAAVVRVQR